MRKTWPAAVVLACALVAVQHFGLERTAERREEARAGNIADLKASRVLPQYIATLFMGPFRAVFVDVLWVELRRLGEEEHRYFEMVEIMEMIASLQPRNPEVWAHQAHNASYNIASNVRDPEERWRWIRYGLEKLEEATRQMAADPYLKMELGRVLLHKATWRDGFFDEDYVKRFMDAMERDAAFRRAMLRGREASGPVTPFEAAIPWFEAAAEDLRRWKSEKRWQHMRATGAKAPDERDYVTNQVGLNIHPYQTDGMVRQAHYYQGWYFWKRGRFADAERSFRAARERALLMIQRYADIEGLPGILTMYANLNGNLADLAAKFAKAPPDAADALEPLSRVLFATGGSSVDQYYVLQQLTAIKQALGGDAFEFNDGLWQGTPIRFGVSQSANLSPAGDVDYYSVDLRVRQERPAHGPREEREFDPQRVGFQVRKRGDCDLRATILARREGAMPSSPQFLEAIATIEIRGGDWQDIEGVVRRSGPCLLRIESLDPAAAAGSKLPAYEFGWTRREPAP